AGLQHGREVELVGLAFEQQPAGEVPELVDLGILGRADQPSGVLEGVAGGHVQAGHHHVEARQHPVVEVESVLEDVHLGAGQQTEVAALGGVGAVHRRHGRDL
ncbi:MAG: hypothetical protein ACK55I_13010, partial [bacterium]